MLVYPRDLFVTRNAKRNQIPNGFFAQSLIGQVVNVQNTCGLTTSIAMLAVVSENLLALCFPAFGFQILLVEV